MTPDCLVQPFTVRTRLLNSRHDQGSRKGFSGIALCHCRLPEEPRDPVPESQEIQEDLADKVRPFDSSGCRDDLTTDPVATGEQSPDDVSDRSLIRRLRTGSQDAATQLYLRYAKRLHLLSQAEYSPGLAARVASHDIVHSVVPTVSQHVYKGY